MGAPRLQLEYVFRQLNISSLRGPSATGDTWVQNAKSRRPVIWCQVHTDLHQWRANIRPGRGFCCSIVMEEKKKKKKKNTKEKKKKKKKNGVR